jgi:hypothetical protein
MKCISIVALGTWGDFSPLLSAAAELARDADTAVQVITHFQHLERLLNECGPNIILSPDNKRMHCIEHGVSPALRLRIDHLLSSMRQFQIQIPNAVTTHIAVRLIGVDLPIYMKPAEEVLRLEQAIVETKLCESLCQSNGSDPKLIVFSPYSMHVLHAADLLGPAYIPILISPGWFDDLLKQYALDLDSPQMPGLIRSCQSNASPRWTVHDFERGWMVLFVVMRTILVLMSSQLCLAAAMVFKISFQNSLSARSAVSFPRSNSRFDNPMLCCTVQTFDW